MVRFVFQCASWIARNRRRMGASSPRSVVSIPSVQIPKKPIHPTRYALTLRMHARSELPQFRGVRSRIFASMRSFERFDKSTSTAPSSGVRRKRKPRKCRSSGRRESEAIPHLLRDKYAHLVGESRLVAAAEENVLAQLENLRTYPFVSKRLEAGTLKVAGWVFKIATAQVFAYDPKAEQFVPVVRAAGPP